MILTCQTCARRYAVDDAAAGKRAECPHCGHIQRAIAPPPPGPDDKPVRGSFVPEEPPGPLKTNRPGKGGSGGGAGGGGSGGGGGGGADASRMRGPSDRLPPRAGPETTVLVVRPSMLRSRPGPAAIVLVAMLAALVGAIYALVNRSSALAAVGGVVFVVCLGTLGVWKVRSLGQTLQITTKRVVFRDGLLARRTQEMAHKVIQDMEVQQTLLQRIWGVGDLTLSNSGQEDDEIRIANIAGPNRVKEIIDSYRNL